MTETKTAVKETCTRCGGLGYIRQFSYNQGGKCFRCDGEGKVVRLTQQPKWFGRSRGIIKRPRKRFGQS